MTKKPMSKKEQYEIVKSAAEEIFANNKHSKKLAQAIFDMLEEHLAPKRAGGKQLNPSYIDEETGMTMHYCRYYAEYFSEDLMVMSKGKSKGYTKLAIAVWNKARREVAKLKEEVFKLYDAEELDKARELKNIISQIETDLNKPEFFRDEDNNRVVVESLDVYARYNIIL